MCNKRALLIRLLLIASFTFYVAGFSVGCGPISLTPPSEAPVGEAAPVFQDAQRAFAAGRFEEAIQLWEQVAPTDPRYLDAQMGIRQARLQIARITTQEVTSEQEISRFDRYVEQAEQFEQQGDFYKALETYEEARLLAPENTLLHEKIEELHVLLDDAVERHQALGELYFAQEEYEKAKQEWERLLLIDPENEKAKQRLADIEVLTATSDSVFFQRGRTLMQKGLINQAASEFEKAQRVNPNNTRTLVYLHKLANIPYTEYLVRKGDTLSSIAEKYSGNPGDFTILLDFNQLQPQDPLKIGQKIHIPHILNFQKTIDPQGKDTLADLDEKAEENQSNLLPRDITSPIAPAEESLTSIEDLFEQGIAAYNQKNYREAMQIFQQVYERNPENQEAYEYFLRAASAIKGGMPIVGTKPADSVEKDRNIDAEVETLIQQGVLAWQAGNLKAAMATFEKANQLAPQNREIQEYLEKIQDDLKKRITFHLNEGIKFFNKEAIEDAILEWEKVLDLDPDNPQALEYRERAKKMLDALATPQ